jgi:hypothetical protein
MPVRLVSGIRRRFQRLSQSQGQVTHVLLTRSPLIRSEQAPSFTVRLACFKHAASVRPEPGSNSPLMSYGSGEPDPTLRSDSCESFMIWQNGYLAYPFVQKESFKEVVVSSGCCVGQQPVGVYLASIFDTLLSSQGADAHLLGPLGPRRGNLSTLALPVRAGQIDLPDLRRRGPVRVVRS